MSPDDFNEKLRRARQFMQLDQFSEALPLYGKLVREYPRGGLWGEYGRAASIAGDFELALKVWDKLRDFEPATPQLLCQLAWEHQNIRLHSSARELYAEAGQLAPRDLDVQLNLASVLVKTDSVEAARVAVDKCVALAPDDPQCRYLAAHLNRRDNQLDAAEKQFRDLLATNPPEPYLVFCCHSELAQIYDRTGRFEEAMAELEKGKAEWSRHADTRSDQELEARQTAFTEQVKTLPKDILERWGKTFPPGSRTRFPPVTLLTGPARSGTTLLEKILDAHPRVAACDEPIAFQAIARRMDLSAPVISSQSLNSFRQRYVKNIANVLGKIEKGQMILDKNPSRTDWIPAFLRVFPELKVIIALRDPRDVMVSLYFQNQMQTNHLTFERLAVYYRGVMDLWLVLREWQGLAWLQTRYEDIVADLPKEAARVNQFLGLEWTETQARYFEQNREKPVMSTNYTDVTQPVYNRSVGRWRAYEKQLAPVLPLLEPYCKEFGYA